MADVDYVLRQRVQQVNNLVVQLAEQVGSVSGQVATVQSNQQQTHIELQQLRAQFLEYVNASRLAHEMQMSQTRVGVLQDQIDHEYGHYNVVRHSATGLLQAFDLGLVSPETVQSVSEQLMLQTPRYWLAPALVALACWSDDDRELCEKAVQEAFRRSPDRTSLFFALVLRRQNRPDAAVRWLRHYLIAQDPTALGRSFAVILEAIAQGAFGLAGRELLNGTLAGWREQLMDSADTQQRQIARWREEVDSLTRPSAAAEFPRLVQVSPQWPQLDSVLRRARAHEAVLEKYQAIMEREFQPSERLEDAVDNILDRLVTEYDDEELPLRRELAFNQAVIDSGGDVDEARRAAEADAASYDGTLDYLTVQTTAALNPSAIGTSPATQRLAVAACQEWFLQAHAQFTRDYRAAVPQDVQARYGTSYTVASSTFQLPPWTGSFTQALADLERSLAAHWDQHMQPFIASFAYHWSKKAMPLALVVAAILIIVGSFNFGFALVAAGVVGGVWGLILRNEAQTAARHQENARQILEAAKLESLHHLRAASAELTDWNAKLRGAEAVEPRCRQLIQSLATATRGGSPFEGRTVPKEEGTS
ncbi:hypothetical protein ABZT17_12465 [Streptomyces sp. NPDC005648]|uniref:hypothetical protein n=1 Tax=Streptomyces sp. NPDC005648 TaxID=3157044 RepID=UPI0033A5E28E